MSKFLPMLRSIAAYGDRLVACAGLLLSIYAIYVSVQTLELSRQQAHLVQQDVAPIFSLSFADDTSCVGLSRCIKIYSSGKSIIVDRLTLSSVVHVKGNAASAHINFVLPVDSSVAAEDFRPLASGTFARLTYSVDRQEIRKLASRLAEDDLSLLSAELLAVIEHAGGISLVIFDLVSGRMVTGLTGYENDFLWGELVYENATWRRRAWGLPIRNISPSNVVEFVEDEKCMT